MPMEAINMNANITWPTALSRSSLVNSFSFIAIFKKRILIVINKFSHAYNQWPIRIISEKHCKKFLYPSISMLFHSWVFELKKSDIIRQIWKNEKYKNKNWKNMLENLFHNFKYVLKGK